MQEKEGAAVAASHSIGFCEVSVAEYTPSLYKAFEKLIHQLQARPQHKPNRKFSVSKMLGTLIGGGGGNGSAGGLGLAGVICNNGSLNTSLTNGNHLYNGRNYSQGCKRILAISQGTVVPCHKGELHKPRVLKRRQGIIANITAI